MARMVAVLALVAISASAGDVDAPLEWEPDFMGGSLPVLPAPARETGRPGIESIP